MQIDVIIPAYNEEPSVGKVVSTIPRNLVREIVVADNNSTDRTAEVAETAGATVLPAPRQGYGSACLVGIAYLNAKPSPPDIIVFMDADFSDHPEQLKDLVAPIIAGEMDMVIGSRALGKKEKGSMAPQQIFGNWLATRMMRVLYGVRFTDLGPFRAISLEALNKLNMRDKDYGWTVEMQVKAAKMNLRFTEIPVDYRKRIGKSKIAGTVKGTILAGYKIISTIIKYS